MSFANVILYSSVIPEYNSEEDESKSNEKKVITDKDPEYNKAMEQLFRN
ncbi:hypothetical protein [Capnocytophaga canimorsus]